MKKAVGIFFCLAVIVYFLSTQWFVFMGSCEGDCHIRFEGDSFDWAYVTLSVRRGQEANEMVFDHWIASGNEPTASYNEAVVRDPLAMVKLNMYCDCRTTIWGTVRTSPYDQCMILLKKDGKYQIHKLPIDRYAPIPVELVCRVE